MMNFFFEHFQNMILFQADFGLTVIETRVKKVKNQEKWRTLQILITIINTY